MKKYILILLIIIALIIFVIIGKDINQKKIISEEIDQKSVEKYNISITNNNLSETSDTKASFGYYRDYFLEPGKYVNFRLASYAVLYNLKDHGKGVDTSFDNFQYIVNSYADVDSEYRKDFLLDYQQLMINVVQMIINNYIENKSDLLEKQENELYITYFDYYTLNMFNYIFCNLLYLMDNEISYPYDVDGTTSLVLKGSNASADFMIDKDLFYQKYNPQYNISNDYILTQNEMLLQGLEPYLIANNIDYNIVVEKYKSKLFNEEIAKKFNYVIDGDNIYLTLQSVITFVGLYEKYKINNDINLEEELDSTYEYLKISMKYDN